MVEANSGDENGSNKTKHSELEEGYLHFLFEAKC